MRVKLFTIWFGPIPSWLPKFKSRMKLNNKFTHELIYRSPLEINYLASDCSGIRVRKGTKNHPTRGYPWTMSFCDLRPMFGQMFQDRLLGYDWWGWCDLDVLVGDLDGLFGPLLEDFDVISTERNTMSGCMSLIRNSEATNSAYKLEELYKKLLSSEQYKNFDESEFNLDNLYDQGGVSVRGFSGIVRRSGLRCHFDDRSWHEGQSMIGDRPSRTCRAEGKKLIEIPTGREITTYHFGSKVWPLIGEKSRFDHL